ncbi:MAG: hypothetical protein FWE21_02425 [Defluviitaleaceae bacterium]|nr:hypothetical protein [Defluviitaleaceae bacterium]
MDMDFLNIKPMESYEAPKVPALDDVYKNPEPLKKLPARWVKNAVVAATAGILGLATLAYCGTGYLTHGQYCNEYGVGYHGFQDFDLVIRVHHGGFGSASYVVHMTEQEALGIIRRRLEAAGLRFCDTPPNYTVFDNASSRTTVGLSLFDKENNVAVAHIGWEADFGRFTGRWDAERAKEVFAQQTDIKVGTFYASHFQIEGVNARIGRLSRRQRREAQVEARSVLEKRLNNQIEAFIKFLHNEGIME